MMVMKYMFYLFQKWVTELMNLSKVTWSIKRTTKTPSEKAKKHTFKREYHCHFNTYYRPRSGTKKNMFQGIYPVLLR
jgi:hypothetical protein